MSAERKRRRRAALEIPARRHDRRQTDQGLQLADPTWPAGFGVFSTAGS